MLAGKSVKLLVMFVLLQKAGQSTAFFTTTGSSWPPSIQRAGCARLFAFARGCLLVPPPPLSRHRQPQGRVGGRFGSRKLSMEEPGDKGGAQWSGAPGAPIVNGSIDPEARSAGTIPPVVGDIRRLSTDTLCVRPRAIQEDVRRAPRGHFVELFRGCAPYIRAHQGATMVIHISGEIVENPSFLGLMDDLGLLALLGVR